MQNPVSWFDIHAIDLDRARKFYEEVFQFTMQDAPMDDNTRTLMFPSDMEGMNISGMLVEKKDAVLNGEGSILYFACQDCAVEESRVEKAGGQVVQSKTAIGDNFGFYALVKDTEDNTIGLHSNQ